MEVIQESERGCCFRRVNCGLFLCTALDQGSGLTLALRAARYIPGLANPSTEVRVGSKYSTYDRVGCRMLKARGGVSREDGLG